MNTLEAIPTSSSDRLVIQGSDCSITDAMESYKHREELVRKYSFYLILDVI